MYGDDVIGELNEKLCVAVRRRDVSMYLLYVYIMEKRCKFVQSFGLANFVMGGPHVEQIFLKAMVK